MPHLLTVKEAAAVLRCDPETLRRKIRRRQLPGVLRHGGLIRIDRAALLGAHTTIDDESRSK